ncbi:MAG: 1-deoxy-D-xylulose-5-phosphate synthase [Candidatus Eisenbacteria bacterium]|uniref:1-deoxy-D-xylulose-5-phosphate synthase n=1 Tax=Eiseniibacteriota bacterium TaxID=2212470 RepID=A0A948RYU7_UNCEI|nr:1-deoxy-D-xylulose-5-phosphate synthase [Candidatus Eisenbacteria bacterium]MBU1948421.1 1-deoxy-D-xylulose-5-phosphate synthase [Candidatus Eisenbacteria bacterium]MBU2692132.1 1-deoxy-D-xylulose-5-phosphate synthase [Candidatus Eisenbacteria bacterium]
MLSRINSPADLRALTPAELVTLCQEIRDYIVPIVTRVGGHLAPSLGVVELTVALHRVFETPRDKMVWDVGHQSYIHKVLTGRRDEMKTIRQAGGLSGFCKRMESPYDAFGAGHASTAISSALGIAIARDLADENYKVLAVVGDGGMTGGLSYEGLNNAGSAETDFVVILNDNAMSISPNVGALSKHLSHMISSPLFNRVKDEVWKLTEFMPATGAVRQTVRKLEESLKTLMVPGMFFEDLGFRYLGPLDGHNVKSLVNVLERVRGMKGAILVHVLTTKGKGLPSAEGDPVKYHGVKPLAAAVTSESGKVKAAPNGPAYTNVFSGAMLRLAELFPEMVAVTAAMAEGTGLHNFAEKHPGRFFDVGIAEAHAVCFSAGMAAQGLRPVTAIYSTFLQRAFDQVIHDVALQKLPVVFALDRAGIVGEDGPTHHGAFDLSYLGCVPNMILCAPRNGRELCNLLYTGLMQKENPFAVRYPRVSIPEQGPLDDSFEEIPLGSWEVMREGKDLCILAVGTMAGVAEEAVPILDRAGLTPTLVNARFINPMDEKFLNRMLDKHRTIVTMEENVLNGGFGAKVARWLNDMPETPAHRRIHIGLPDEFVTHGSRSFLLKTLGLDAEGVAGRILAGIQTDVTLQQR